MARNFCGSLHFFGLAIFLCSVRELIFVIRTDWFFLPGVNFLRFSESSQYYGVRTLCKYNQYFVVYRFVSERKTQVVIEQTRFVSTVFLYSEFKSENIYSEVNFCGKNFGGNLYLREL